MCLSIIPVNVACCAVAYNAHIGDVYRERCALIHVAKSVIIAQLCFVDYKDMNSIFVQTHALLLYAIETYCASYSDISLFYEWIENILYTRNGA